MTASLWVRQLGSLGVEETASSSIEKERFFSTYLNAGLHVFSKSIPSLAQVNIRSNPVITTSAYATPRL